MEEPFEGSSGGIEIRAFDDDMTGIFEGRATETAKSFPERKMDVFAESLETGGVAFQPVVTVAKAMQND